jgi:hypothetical protein
VAVVVVVLGEEGDYFDFTNRLVVPASVRSAISPFPGGRVSSGDRFNSHCTTRICSKGGVLTSATRSRFGGGDIWASMCLRFSGEACLCLAIVALHSTGPRNHPACAWWRVCRSVGGGGLFGKMHRVCRHAGERWSGGCTRPDDSQQTAQTVDGRV